MKPLRLIVLVAFSIIALGQTPTPSGSITGTVQDQSGALIPGVTVTATGTAGKFTVLSAVNGVYTFSNLPVGMYTVDATLSGFTPVRFTNVEVGNAITVRLLFTLTVASRLGTPIPPAPRRDQNLNIVADSQTAQGNSVLYRGNVRMTTDTIQLVADELYFDTRQLTGDARGKVRIRVLPRALPLSAPIDVGR